MSPNNRLPKLPALYAGVVMPFVLSILMTFVVSGISTAKSLGLSLAAAETWPLARGLSWLAAFQTLLVLLPAVRRIVAALVEAPGAPR